MTPSSAACAMSLTRRPTAASLIGRQWTLSRTGGACCRAHVLAQSPSARGQEQSEQDPGDALQQSELEDRAASRRRRCCHGRSQGRVPIPVLRPVAEAAILGAQVRGVLRRQPGRRCGIRVVRRRCAPSMQRSRASLRGACHARRRCSVYRTRLGGHSLLVSAEIDCEEALADGARAFVEIKTSGSMQTPESRCNFRERKLIKYWIQSYVAGVPTIVVGYRSEDGVLTVSLHHPPPPLPPHRHYCVPPR